MTHICVSDLTRFGSDYGLSPGRRQAIIRTNAGILLIRLLGTNFEIVIFSFKKMRMKMSSAKRRPFCLGLKELMRTDAPFAVRQMVAINLIKDLTCNYYWLKCVFFCVISYKVSTWYLHIHAITSMCIYDNIFCEPKLLNWIESFCYCVLDELGQYDGWDALYPCVAGSSSAMILHMLDKQLALTFTGMDLIKKHHLRAMKPYFRISRKHSARPWVNRLFHTLEIYVKMMDTTYSNISTFLI